MPAVQRHQRTTRLAPTPTSPAGEEAEDGHGTRSPGRHATVNPNQGEEAGAIRNVTWTTSTGDTHEPSPPPMLGPGCYRPPDLADDGPPLSTLVDIIWTPNSSLTIQVDAA